MSKQSRGAALPPVFALRVSTGSRLLGNSKLFGTGDEHLPGSPKVQLGSKSTATDGNTGKSWGPTALVRVQRQKNEKTKQNKKTRKLGFLILDQSFCSMWEVGFI